MIDFHLKKSKGAPFAVFCSIGKLAEEGLVQGERGVAFQLLEIALKRRSLTKFLQYKKTIISSLLRLTWENAALEEKGTEPCSRGTV